MLQPEMMFAEDGLCPVEVQIVLGGKIPGKRQEYF